MPSDGEEKSKGLMRPLVQVAGVLGIIQGFVWTLLSIAAILFYYMDLAPSTGKEISHKIYTEYFHDSTGSKNGFIINPNSLSYCSYVYLILSFGWFLISCLLYWGVVKKSSNEQFYDYSILGWTIAASLVSILDLIMLALFAHDYNKVSTSDTILLVVVGIMMTLAARGFVLWVINVLFAVILGMHYYRRYNELAPTSSQSAIDAYSDPLPWLQGPAAFDDPHPKTYDNKGYQPDREEAPIRSNPPSIHQFPVTGINRDSARNNYVNPRSNLSQEPPPKIIKRPVLNHNNNNDSSWIHRNANYNNNYVSPLRPQPEPGLLRTAKIGKQGGQRSPPLIVNAPSIPEPDYSPPSSPVLRGVLKPRSNYTMY
ncbi:uncharacterized protein LOC126747329 isoform X2 [Anthonomus grandis grandis]|uniref:uncharacterized protein LOC126747329 isoform X2 n=1 Tax=Anthonomus grandis grandis TaxID=2921223 RepID=UPI00216674C7|nr:uncharacterized protein LOC126747329 isoform X2 [Anthonomus grandis grandis]